MTRSEAVKSFIIKSVLPVAAALLLYCIFKSACMSWTMYGSGYSAACPSASIGCASGLCRAAAPWVEGSPCLP